MTNGNKNNFFWRALTLLLGSASLKGTKDILLWQLFFRTLYLFDSIFQGLFGLISCIILIKEFVFQTMVALEIGKRIFFSYHSSNCSVEIKLHQKTWILIQYDWKEWVDWISARWDKKSQPQNWTFLEKGCKS